MGKCPERPSPSPPAVVGTFPYNLLNGTAGKRRIMLWGFNRRFPPSRVAATTVWRGHRVARGLGEPRECLTAALPPLCRTLDLEVDLPEDGDSPRHYLE